MLGHPSLAGVSDPARRPGLSAEGKHLYPFDDPRSEKAGRLLATLSGPVLDPSPASLNIKYVRQDVNFDPAGALGAMAESGVEPGSTQKLVETTSPAASKIRVG